MSEILDDNPTEANDEVKIENMEPECSKPKKRRRGKKKRNRSSDNSNVKEAVEGTQLLETMENCADNKKRRKLVIRPIDVPKAPENSTQFIIDDHDECHLYFNFEKPHPYGEISRIEGDNASNDAAFQDIDYEYHSLEDADNSAYYLKDFELSYKNLRYEEITRLTKPDLVDAIETLEVRTKELEHELIKNNPKKALEQCQRKLLRLQEENVTLRELQNHLRKTVSGEGSADENLHNSGSEQFHHSDSEQLNEMSEADTSEYSSNEGLDLSDAESNASNQGSSSFNKCLKYPESENDSNHCDYEMSSDHDFVTSDFEDVEQVNDSTNVSVEEDSDSASQLNNVNHKQSENCNNDLITNFREESQEPIIEQSQDSNSRQSHGSINEQLSNEMV